MSNNTIKLKNYLNIFIEKVANAAITPGMLIEIMSTDKVRAHATSEGNVLPMFALESDLEGEDITDAYAADDQVQCWIPQRGDEVYALIADGQNIVIGDFLVSNGDGYLKEYTTEVQSDAEMSLQIVGQAIAAVNTSDSAVATSRVKIRVV